MKMEMAKGTKDVPPEEELAKQQIISTLKKTFEVYGFSPLETPVLERIETLTAKYGGGSEITKEIFKLTDQGGRSLGLRFDLTVPLARFVAMNPNVKLPFKRYQIGLSFRDGPIKLGRYREFWQCDVDIVGSKSTLADAELVKLAFDFFKKIGLNIEIEVNNRKILDGIMESLFIPEKEWNGIILSIDKLKKIPLEEIKKELKIKGMYEKQINEMFEIFDMTGNNDEKIAKLRSIIKSATGIEGLDEIEGVLSYIKNKNLVFRISLARGLDYYTGTVFEAFTKDESLRSSLAAGGRWDKMISQFMESNAEIPAVGISFGIDTISDALNLKKKISPVKTLTKVFVIPINIEKEAVKLLDKLRSEGLNVEIDLMQRGISKNLDYANSLGIPFVIILGKEELKSKKFKLKDMKTGNEKLLNEKSLIKELKKE
ncbi:MAG: histidine--tRNA ligase [Nanoarchaeota archaeon]|nr:histidine--tRNA ligase [Nanoarchaeota archaeon]